MVSFDKIPQSIRTPLFYVEFDPSKANSGQQNARALLIGQKLAAGTLDVNVPQLVTSLAAAKVGAGAGSVLAQMYETYRLNDAVGEVWVLPVADAAGTAATGTITIGGPATGNGTIFLYVGGRLVSVSVASGDTASEIAALVAAAITATADLAVSAAVDGEETTQVNLTALHKGTVGNDIDVRVNYAGSVAGEALPAGVTVAIVALADGATDPSLTTALSNLGDEEYDFLGIAFNDTTVLDAIKVLMDEDTGRWSWLKQIYGGGFAAKRGSVGTLSTFGGTRNDKAVTIMGFNGSPSPYWEWSAAYCAQSAVSINAHPARPLQSLPLIGIKAPPVADRFSLTERETLLHDGIATFTVARDGTVRISRDITTYQENLFGQPDDAWLDVPTLAIGWTFVRRMRSAITTKFPRHLLAQDGTRIGEGQPVATPKGIKAELVAEYIGMERDGIVQDVEFFIANTIVEIDANNKNRLNVLATPAFMRQLRIFASRVQFV
tara:strand:- start:14140 stop:15618 length:1479 start_codon:yes stop_codon:yes gene_type:complete